MEEQMAVIEGAIRAVYDLAVGNEQRVHSSKVIEAAKDQAPNEVEQIAYALISKEDLLLARTGWNFLEHIIKFKWLEVDALSRLMIRNTCFDRIKSGAMIQPELRCAGARCVVFMIQHEWPQNWPELFDQLDDVASVSVIHAHIPFIVLQFLVENVVTLANIENPLRRKDLNNAISSNLPRIFHSIHVALRECSCHATDESYSLIHCALNLFSEFAEWVPALALEPYLDDLLCLICSYLQTPQHSICEAAVKCLWRIASRKRTRNEAVVVYALFGDIPMQSILSAANAAASVGAGDVEHYRFLKTLCNVLSALGIHLSDVWSHRPPNIAIYLAAIEAFSMHPSIYLRNEAVSVFASLTSHEQIRNDEMFMECINRVISAAPSLLEKIGYPSRNDCETCLFSQHDYDDDNDFSQEFTQFRNRFLQVIQTSCTEKNVNMLVSIVEKWINIRCLSCPNAVRETEWDAMHRFSRLILSECHSRKLLQPDDYRRLALLFNGIVVLLTNCSSPSLMNNLLSVLSALLIVIGSYPELLKSLLSLLRTLLSDGMDDDIGEKSVKRHCIALLLRLVTNLADDIKGQAEAVLDFCLSICPYLSLMQSASCMQVIAALSNLCIDFETQSSFLSSALSGSVNYILQPEIQQALQNDEAFLSYFGFMCPAPTNSEEISKSLYLLNRRTFRAHLSTLDGIMAQSCSVNPPAHPAYVAYKPILPSMFLLAKRLNSLYDQKNVDKIHASYRDVSIFDITSSERQQLLTSIDLCTPSSARIVSDDPGTHARAFFFDITEKTQTLIGHFATKTATQLFSDPEICKWASDLSSHLSFVPDFRLRYWIRRTWKPFFSSCPETAYQKVRQMLLTVAEELNRRLENLWEQIAAFDFSEDEPIQEQLAEHITCILTRECVALLRHLFGILDSDMSCEKIEEATSLKDGLLKDTIVAERVIALMFLCLTCRDTNAALRVVPVCRIATESLSDKCGEEMALFMLVRSIQSLQIHGSDEVALSHLLSLVFLIYSLLRERFPSLSLVLQQVPECSKKDVERLDSRIASLEGSVNEKIKREVMKKLLRSVIATAVGKQYRRPVHLRSLPPLSKRNKDAIEDFTDIALLFKDV